MSYPMSTAPSDVVDAVLDIRSGSGLDLLRRSRTEIRLRTQANYDVLFARAAKRGLTSAERFAAAWRAASEAGSQPLADYYLAHWRAAEDEAERDSTRLNAILAHAARVGREPASSQRQDLENLSLSGLDEDDIVTLSQIIGFVAYQARLLVGLALLGSAA